MSLSLVTARQLCSKAELTLFSESSSRNVRAFNERELRSRISRARKLRDKYRQRADRQDREARGKQLPRRGRPAKGSEATRKKEQLFSEALDRFGSRLKQLGTQESRTQAVKRASKKKVTTKSARTKRPNKKAASKPKRVVKKVPTKKKSQRAARKTSAASVADFGSTKSKPATKISIKKTTAAAKQARLRASGRKRIDKHISAENRRRQARRDAR